MIATAAAESLPIAEAALAVGAPYDLALGYADAFQADSGALEQAAYDRLVASVGPVAARECARMLVTAALDGRIPGRGSRA